MTKEEADQIVARLGERSLTAWKVIVVGTKDKATRQGWGVEIAGGRRRIIANYAEGVALASRLEEGGDLG